ncbi:MAG: hypothetical protein LBL54_00535 [Clostridiales Family XIII bacterium]|jgi:hypothetical protein|nr:hypothetical protein [Clostridiales Family XIII bacterium]
MNAFVNVKSMRRGRPLAFALVLVLMLVTVMSVSGFAYAAPTNFDPVSIETGSPVYIAWDYWNNPSQPSPYNGTVTPVTGSSLIPNTFLLWVDDPTDGTAIIKDPNVTAQFQYKSADGSSSAYLVDISNINTTTLILTVDVVDPGHPEWEGNYQITSPPPNGTLPGGNPYDDNGYLPIGQYANGSGWGSLFSDGTNVTGNTKKFLSGQESTGVSLGVGGGYVQFDMTGTTGGGIANNPLNPYGVDFIVYGNAFSGNPEAGAVKVSTDGAVWYELAGSLYYDTTTLRNVNVTYQRVNGKADIRFSTDNGSTWNTTTFAGLGSRWWPSYAASGNNGNYQRVWNIHNKVSGVSWDNTTDMITYGGVSIVPFSSSTDYYQFGYADVHANGGSYGKAANPYTITASGAAGDGFDLSWAVDGSGNPVYLASAKYIRVYTAVIRNAGVLGETSTEVSGLYVTNNVGSGNVTSTPAISVGGVPVKITSNLSTIDVKTGTTGTKQIVVAPAAATSNTFINSANSTTGSVNVTGTNTNLVRVVVQEGDKNPFIVLLRITRA